ncbi:uncharacterized protein LOC143035283 [Oratosquilla oratoria]|uniref:uncharacterized protein LOC143035283 n=1 Tax=Oratosquilla oratoria TaxID=337810 RepID=UPI003F764209
MLVEFVFAFQISTSGTCTTGLSSVQVQSTSLVTLNLQVEGCQGSCGFHLNITQANSMGVRNGNVKNWRKAQIWMVTIGHRHLASTSWCTVTNSLPLRSKATSAPVDSTWTLLRPRVQASEAET